MVRFAKRVAGMEISGIRRMFEVARRLEDPCDFSLGLPDFDIPPEVKAAMHEAIDGGFNRYTPTQGIPEAIRAVGAHLKRTYGIQADEQGTLITSGSTGALFAACMALVDEGDEVLIPDPYFVLYPKHVEFCQGRVVPIDTYESGFKLTPELLERHLTPRTKALIFNNPVNPTGIAYAPEEVRALAEVARRRGLVVLADEVYDHFSYDFKHESFLPHAPETTVLVGALSKTHAMTGWRLGYAVGPAEIIEKMMMIQQFTYVCAPSVAQHAAVAALRAGPDPKITEIYRRKRDRVVEALQGKFEFEMPRGAFYVFPKARDGDADALVERALERQVVVVPGRTASRRNTHFRISYAVADARLERGLRLLRELA